MRAHPHNSGIECERGFTFKTWSAEAAAAATGTEMSRGPTQRGGLRDCGGRL